MYPSAFGINKLQQRFAFALSSDKTQSKISATSTCQGARQAFIKKWSDVSNISNETIDEQDGERWCPGNSYGITDGTMRYFYKEKENKILMPVQIVWSCSSACCYSRNTILHTSFLQHGKFTSDSGFITGGT